MNIKHIIRRGDIDISFRDIDEKYFTKGLEIGAGDGFQSQLLSKYIQNLVCTEYYPDSFSKVEKYESIEYKILDATHIRESFSNNEFDIIFSSNVLEHLFQIGKVLDGMYFILKDDGLMIHIMPNRLWKSLHLLIWYLKYPKRIKKKYSKSIKVNHQNNWKVSGNNPAKQELKQKTTNKNKYLVPKPHGISNNNITEFIVFGKNYWKKLFVNVGFDIVEIRKLQFHTPYRYNFEFGRRLLTKLGLCSSYAYFLKKRIR